MQSSRGKILVIRGGAIGDFILTLPALAALRRQFPQARLEILGYPHIVQLALRGGLADAARSIEARALAGFFARGGDLDAELQEYFAGFALIVSYLYDPDRIFQMNVALCSRAQFVVGPHRPDDSAGMHATEVFLQPLMRLAIFEADRVPRLDLRPAGFAARDPKPLLAETGVQPKVSSRREEIARTLAVHPGSGGEFKNWPEHNWAELLDHLTHSVELDFLIVGGEAERGRLERLAACIPFDRVQIARNLPLTELAERLAACEAFIGHDSGISHLAAAVGVPALVLWGDGVEAVWRPQGERVTIIRDAAGLDALSVECVVNALADFL